MQEKLLLHAPRHCLSEHLLSDYCAPGPEQGAGNKMVKTVDTIPGFTDSQFDAR